MASSHDDDDDDDDDDDEVLLALSTAAAGRCGKSNFIFDIPMSPTSLKTKPTKASVFASCDQQKTLLPLPVPFWLS